MTRHLTNRHCLNSSIFFIGFFLSITSLVAQNEYGWEAYDSVKVDLKNGAITDRYLPFDVPFRIYGDAKGLSAVRLSIVESGQLGCCGQENCADEETYFLDCDCPCISVRQQRLMFYRNIRRIKEYYDSLLNRMNLPIININENIPSQLQDTLTTNFRELVESYYDSLPDSLLNKINLPTINFNENIPFQLKDTLIGNFRKLVESYYDSLPDSINLPFIHLSTNRSLKTQADSITATFRALIKYYEDRISKLDFNKYTKYNSSIDSTRNNFESLLKEIDNITKKGDSIRERIISRELTYGITDVSLIDQFNSIDSQIFKKTQKADLISDTIRVFQRNRLNGYESLLKFKSDYLRFIKALEKDLSFVKKHQLNWQNYIEDYDSFIEKDSLKTCASCDLNPYNCNFIGEWKRDTVGRSRFYLDIPPLEANRGYKFFFEIERQASTSEKSLAKYVASKLLVRSLDSIINEPYRQMKLNPDNSDIRHIRRELIQGKVSNWHYTLIEETISNYLVDYYGSTIDVKTRKLVFDSLILKRLTNHFISHQYYKEELDSLIDRNEENKVYRSFLYNPILANLNAYYENFFKEKKLDDYYLLDSLYLLNENSVLSGLSANRDVPSGLRPYDNLQKLTLRKLQDLEDFDEESALEYTRNLKIYLDYLKRLQAYINDDLIRNSNDLRLRLFDPKSLGSSTTLRTRQNRDRNLVRILHNLSRNLYRHEIEVRATLNFYENFQDNVSAINETVKSLLDSALSLSNRIRFAVNREAGGLVSANFQTRTEWYVSADVGLAYSTLGEFPNQTIPYAGVNFNFTPINRQAHYSLFKINKKQKLKGLPPLCDDNFKFMNILKRWKKASSFVVGVALTDFTSDIDELESTTSNSANQSIHLLTGYGLRITEAGRYSIGVIWLRQSDPNASFNRSVVKPFLYQSLSFDIDVASALGAVGEFLFPGRIGKKSGASDSDSESGSE